MMMAWPRLRAEVTERGNIQEVKLRGFDYLDVGEQEN